MIKLKGVPKDSFFCVRDWVAKVQKMNKTKKNE